MTWRSWLAIGLGLLAGGLIACSSAPQEMAPSLEPSDGPAPEPEVRVVYREAPRPAPRPGDRLARRGEEIVVCGQLFHAGTKVVLWMDRGGYDAYRAHPRFRPQKDDEPDKARFGSFRRGLPDALDLEIRTVGWKLDDLREVVSQFVIHYDVAGSAARCFKVLHDQRCLSCHFLLDRDGTIYQTLDLKERAWHAGKANDRSIGIEIANIGAYPSRDELAAAQARVGLPVEPVLEGKVHDRQLFQHPFTDAQYRALIKLTAALGRVLPKLRPVAPQVTTLAPDHVGLVGHYHLTRAKVDPGPAFDWARLISGVEALRADD